MATSSISESAALRRAPVRAFLSGAAYALALAVGERILPIKERRLEWLKVALGVLLTVAPAAVALRRAGELKATAYQRALALSFVASSLPVIAWQVGEWLLERREEEPLMVIVVYGRVAELDKERRK